jgi:DNA-binding SARP family transcriptional activator/tetratricopeptide (TPR) repeat protein
MEFRMLGPVEVWAAGQLVDVGPPRQRGVLAALAIDSGRPVQMDTLIDRVWGEAPPPGARQTLYVYLTRLRHALGAAGTPAPALLRRSGGYLLDVAPDRVDIHRFRNLIDQARDPRRAGPERVELLRQALGLWRGAPLADLSGRWPAQVRERWHRERLDAAVRWARLETELGNQTSVIDPLTELTAEYPIVEPLAAALIRALYQAGRGAEALDCYARTCRHLAEELGVDSGTELRQLHQTILRATAPAPAPPAGVATRPVPAQLPLDVRGFAGRAAELDMLNALVTADDRATTVVTIWGTAGVGKTALAVHWAHLVRQRFTDGQLYVNLRGFSPAGTAMSPAEAVRRFLEALDVPVQRIPADLEAQAALFRTLLTGRRMLVLLDNARDPGQIRPLLPGAPGCLVLITSRNQLTGLVAAEGAHALPLDLPSPGEARDLLARRIGHDRTAAERDAVNEIVTGCARLPLALAIVAARATAHPRLPLTTVAADLRDTYRRLDALATGDSGTDVRAVFTSSYQALTPPAARLFRLIGLHPGPDITTLAAASLAGIAATEVRPLLAELTHAHLADEHTAGRYTCHDLLSGYATEQAHALDSRTERIQAVQRLLDHYLHTAHAAALLVDPHRSPITLAPPRPGVTPEPLTTQDQAMSWFAAERLVLLAAIRHAADAGSDTHVWQLGWSLATFLDLQGRWHDRVATQEIALDTARRLADRAGQARAHRLLGRTQLRLGHHDDARVHLGQALDLYRAVGDRTGQANTHLDLAELFERRGRYRKALDHAQESLSGYRATGNRVGQAGALNTAGWIRAHLGEYSQCLTYCQRAVTLFQELGDRRGEATAWDSLGFAHHHLDRYADAIRCYRRALDLYRETRDRYHEAETLARLGDTHQAAGDTDDAGTSWHNALVILDDLDHPDAEQARAKLRHLGQHGSASSPTDSATR